MVLNRDDFLKIKPKIALIDLPSDRGQVYVREITGAQREQFLSRFSSDEQDKNMLTTIACWCVCDADGERFFSDEDIEQVSQLPAEVISAVYWKVSELSFPAVEDEEKKSKANPKE